MKPNNAAFLRAILALVEDRAGVIQDSHVQAMRRKIALAGEGGVVPEGLREHGCCAWLACGGEIEPTGAGWRLTEDRRRAFEEEQEAASRRDTAAARDHLTQRAARHAENEREDAERERRSYGAELCHIADSLGVHPRELDALSCPLVVVTSVHGVQGARCLHCGSMGKLDLSKPFTIPHEKHCLLAKRAEQAAAAQ